MSLPEKFNALRNTAFEKVSIAAREADAAQIERWTAVARECERAAEDALIHLRQAAELKLRLQRLDRAVSSGEPFPEAPVGRKAKGRLNREQVVKQMESADIRLENISGALYRTASRARIAIPFASEMANRRGEWFLGIPDAELDFIVAVCDRLAGDRRIFVLPWDVVRRARTEPDTLRGQRKLHLRERGGRFQIHYRGDGWHRIENFEENWKLLSRADGT